MLDINKVIEQNPSSYFAYYQDGKAYYYLDDGTTFPIDIASVVGKLEHTMKSTILESWICKALETQEK